MDQQLGLEPELEPARLQHLTHSRDGQCPLGVSQPVSGVGSAPGSRDYRPDLTLPGPSAGHYSALVHPGPAADRYRDLLLPNNLTAGFACARENGGCADFYGLHLKGLGLGQPMVTQGPGPYGLCPGQLGVEKLSHIFSSGPTSMFSPEDHSLMSHPPAPTLFAQDHQDVDLLAHRSYAGASPPGTSKVQAFGQSEDINTKEVARKVMGELKRYNIPQAVFARRVLCRSQGTLSDLLRNPKPWTKLKSGRETFRRMWSWLQEPEYQRMSYLRLEASRRKEQEGAGVEHHRSPKRHRLVFTDVQRRTLLAIYKENPRPNRDLQLTIALQLGLELSTVANFFMNSRRRSLDKWSEEGTQVTIDNRQ
ncbi:hepatocyte nuclear factor 6-like [Amblyraja radiata]|uniref:hepatocyte nuclear factor 6-like n=1 Tax=Amblyraja radiata TaxID=386614 RepID=UPI00140306D5|nr:hepatocyte nuclear factor 6-like [Amblyraja radiata]